MTSSPRIAVVGGGIAGTLCSLVLKNRGMSPTIIDLGKNGLGGRMRGHGLGVQFMRATDPRLQGVMGLLQNSQIVAPWQGRFGLLGSKGGGFLPAAIVQSGIGGSSVAGGGIAGLSPADPSDPTTNDQPSAAPTDAGDFCQFVQGGTPQLNIYSGIPSTTAVCGRIADLAQVSRMEATKVVGATMASEGGWNLQLERSPVGSSNSEEHFDGVVVATHDPSLAASMVDTIVNAEVQAGGYSSLEEALSPSGHNDTSSPDASTMLLQRMSNLSQDLVKARASKQPLYALQMTFPQGFSKAIPFDAVSVPGSTTLQFLSREASKPGEASHSEDASGGGEQWTALSTSQLASHVLEQEMSNAEKEAYVSKVLANEVAQLVARYHAGTAADGVDMSPKDLRVQRWGAAFTGKGLALQEDSIVMSSWRLGICGDYIRSSQAYPTPWEAAALSGLEAGERMAHLFSVGEDQA